MKLTAEDIMTEEIQQERVYNKDVDFRVGEYLYMGMGLVGEHRVCISVAYKIGYCVKKALQFVDADPNVEFTHINKVRVGDLEACQRFELKS